VANESSRRLIVEADGGSRANPGPAGYGALVRDAESGAVLSERAGFLGITTNNVAEYTGLVAGLRAAHEIDPAAFVLVRMDSQLVVHQMRGEWKIKHAPLQALAQEARTAHDPALVTYEWVRRELNSDADALANEAMDLGETDPLQEPIVRDYFTQRTYEGQDRTGPAVLPPPTAFQGLDPKAALTLVLVRHGVTELTLIGGLSGGDVPGPPLTARGRTMAAQAADAVYRIPQTWPDLARPSRVLSSPMIRTQETAAAIGRRLGKHVEVDDRLREIEFGEWESLTGQQVEERWPGEFRLWHATGTFAPPGGESYADVGERVAPVIRELRETQPGQSVAIVGHAAMIRAIVAPVLGMPPSHWGRLRVPPCSLTIVRYWPDTAEVVTIGDPTG